jgi:hypothetical protein
MSEEEINEKLVITTNSEGIVENVTDGDGKPVKYDSEQQKKGVKIDSGTTRLAILNNRCCWYLTKFGWKCGPC